MTIAPVAPAPSNVNTIGNSSASGNATSGPPSGRDPASNYRGRGRDGRARGWTSRHLWNGQFRGQPFWPAYGPPMTYATFPTTQMMTPPGIAPHQAPPTVNATAAAVGNVRPAYKNVGLWAGGPQSVSAAGCRNYGNTVWKVCCFGNNILIFLDGISLNIVVGGIQFIYIVGMLYVICSMWTLC